MLQLKDEAFKDLNLYKTYISSSCVETRAFNVVKCILGTSHNPTLTHSQRTLETRISVSN